MLHIMRATMHIKRRAAAGQAMTEFALVLPLLLLLMFGVIEAGRLLVIYSSVQAASREAARYASAAGVTPSGMPCYYMDTAGIQAAGNRIALMVGATVNAPTYDHGPVSSGSPVTFTPASCGDVALGDRVNIFVSAVYNPMLGLTPLHPFTISATTSRTILKQVAITGNPTSGGGGGGGSLEVVITQPSSDMYYTGQVIQFSATASDNDGAVTYSWSSSPGGAMGSGATITYAFSTPDVYVVTVTGTDSSSSDSDTKTITIIQDPPPVVNITAPLNTIYEQGQTIVFSGIAVDTPDGDLSSTMVWKDGSSTLASGTASFSTSSLAAGTHTITASATDSQGQTGSASIIITINPLAPPVVTIVSPSNAASFSQLSSIPFLGTATDFKDGDLAASLHWTSNIDGDIGTGASFSRNLSLGIHLINASVTDSDGLTAFAQVTIYVVNVSPPTVWITSPANGASFNQGVNVSFTGQATASNGTTNISSSIKWYVDWTLFGTGANVTLSSPAAGSHTIRAEVTDPNNGIIGYTTITINIVANTAPVVTIITPSEGAQFYKGDPIPFTGTASDVPDGDLSSSIAWSSNKNTPSSLGTGRAITVTNLIVSTHTITAQVTDSGGLVGSATRTIFVRAQPCEIQSSTFIIDKTILSWQFINNSPYYSYKVTWINLPWTISNPNQALNQVSFGVDSASAYTLWGPSSDTTAGSTFGVTGAEWPWTPISPSFTLEIGPGHAETLYFDFEKSLADLPSVAIVTFTNDATGDTCSYSH
jgi:Flp pilus assembly protein TadG